MPDWMHTLATLVVIATAFLLGRYSKGSTMAQERPISRVVALSTVEAQGGAQRPVGMRPQDACPECKARNLAEFKRSALQAYPKQRQEWQVIRDDRRN